MRIVLMILALGSLPVAGASEQARPLSADEIMARVAVNQDRAEAARAEFVYRQHVVIRLRNSHGTLEREEISDFQATPEQTSTHKELVGFTGRHRKGRSMEGYDQSGEADEDGFRNQADAHLSKNLRDDLISDRKSKDGVAADLFPLTAKQQRKYRFILKGEEIYRDTPVYRIAFEPRKGEDETCWKGEALISKADFQPLSVTTKLAPAIPFLVRTAMGTNLQGLGFSVEYRKFAGDVWFPVSYGTEFRVHVLFVYSRMVSISMTNSDFRRADVKSSVDFNPVQ
ncbi:MAG TPA: hypothetical protein VGL72_10270 [Bryobacteraceae bacterium]|jgi:hypothetical protein